MSSMRLTQDLPETIVGPARKVAGRKGEIVSVPFHFGRELIAAGKVVYASETSSQPATPISAEPASAELPLED